MAFIYGANYALKILRPKLIIVADAVTVHITVVHKKTNEVTASLKFSWLMEKLL